jgi:hypothetical protein
MTVSQALIPMSAQTGPAFLSPPQIGLLTMLHSSQAIVGGQQFGRRPFIFKA